MANYISRFSGKQVDEFTQDMTNFRPQIEVTGLDPNTTVTCVKQTVSLSATTDSNGSYTFILPMYANNAPPFYGVWTISGKVSSASDSDTVNVDKVKKYTLAFS